MKVEYGPFGKFHAHKRTQEIPARRAFLRRNLAAATLTQDHDATARSAFMAAWWGGELLLKEQQEEKPIELQIKSIRRMNAEPIGGRSEARTTKATRPLCKTNATIMIHLKRGASIIASFRDKDAMVVRLQSAENSVCITGRSLSVKRADLEVESDAQVKASFSISFRDEKSVKELGLSMVRAGQNLSHSLVHLGAAAILDLRRARSETMWLPLSSSVKGKLQPLPLETEVLITQASGQSILTSAIQRGRIEFGYALRPKVPTKRYEVSYDISFGEGSKSCTITATHDHLRCEECGKTAFEDINDLVIHLKSWHPEWKYEITKESESGDLEVWRIRMRDSTNKGNRQADARPPIPGSYKPGNLRKPAETVLRGGKDRELPPEIVGHHAPINIQQFVDYHGDPEENTEYFQRQKVGKRRGKQLKPGEPPTRRRLAHEVQSRQLQEKKQYIVPRAPKGVTFRRALTKRPLQEGEVISESDEEIDMGFLDRKIDASIEKNLHIPSSAEKKVMLLWNAHLRQEGDINTLHLGDALYRCAKEHMSEMLQNDWHNEFIKFAAELHRQHQINQSILEGCQDLVIQYEQRRRAKGKGKAKVTDSGVISPYVDDEGDVQMINTVPEPQSAPKYEICICSRRTQIHTEEVVLCASSKCIRSTFHIDCVMKTWKPQRQPELLEEGWYCKDCEDDNDIEKHGEPWYRVEEEPGPNISDDYAPLTPDSQADPVEQHRKDSEEQRAVQQIPHPNTKRNPLSGLKSAPNQHRQPRPENAKEREMRRKLAQAQLRKNANKKYKALPKTSSGVQANSAPLSKVKPPAKKLRKGQPTKESVAALFDSFIKPK